MRFAYDFTGGWGLVLGGRVRSLLWLGFTAMLVIGSFQRGRATKRFGDPALVGKLETFDATGRRDRQGGAARRSRSSSRSSRSRGPQFGHGTRLIPATNLDVVDRARLLEEHVRARRRAEPHRARQGRGRRA